MAIKNVLLITICSLLAVKPPNHKIEEVNWILGTWANTANNDNRQAYEIWERSASGHFKGLGFTLKDGDTSFVEHLEIREKDGHLFYVADVSHNRAAVYFKFTTTTDTLFICQNAIHDFPKEIAYRRDGNNLYAHISDGKKKIDFAFKRVDN